MKNFLWGSKHGKKNDGSGSNSNSVVKNNTGSNTSFTNITSSSSSSSSSSPHLSDKNKNVHENKQKPMVSKSTDLQHIDKELDGLGIEDRIVETINEDEFDEEQDMVRNLDESRRSSMESSRDTSKRQGGLTRSNRSSTISTFLQDSEGNDDLTDQLPQNVLLYQQQQFLQQQLQMQTPNKNNNDNTNGVPFTPSSNSTNVERNQLSRDGNLSTRKLVGGFTPNKPLQNYSTPTNSSNSSSSSSSNNTSRTLRNYSSTDNIRKSMNLSGIRNSFSSSTVSLQSNNNDPSQHNDNNNNNENNKQIGNSMNNPFIENSSGAKRKTRESFPNKNNALKPIPSSSSGRISKSKSKYNLSKDTYDTYLFKSGWLNKTQSGLPNYRESKMFFAQNNNNDSSDSHSSSGGADSYIPDFRLYRVSLQGPILSFYKSGINNVKYFDCNLKYEHSSSNSSVPSIESSSSGSTVGQQGDLHTIHSRDNSKSNSPDTDLQYHNEKDILKENPALVTVWPTLTYLSADDPHPDLKFDSASPSQLVFHDSLEGFIHHLLFTKNLNDTDVENYVLMLPIVSSIIHTKQTTASPSSNELSQDNNNNTLNALKYIHVFLSHFNSTANSQIDYSVEQLMISRAHFILEIIQQYLVGIIMDKGCFQMICQIIDLLTTFRSNRNTDFPLFKKTVSGQRENLESLVSTFKSYSTDKNASKNDLLSDITNSSFFLSIDLLNFAKAVHFINSTFNKVWSPENDYTLLYEIPTKLTILNPLMFKNKENVHFLSKLMVQHLNSTRLTNNNSDADINLMAKKRAQILSKWVQLGCIFEKIGDMVSWLAIATIICSIPILRLSITWKYMTDSILKIIFKDWTPTISQLDRKNFCINSTNIFILAPPDMNSENIDRIVPYFGDLKISKDEMGLNLEGTTNGYEKMSVKQNYKHLLKKINRTKSAFSKWEQKSASFKSQNRNSIASHEFTPSKLIEKIQGFVTQTPGAELYFKQVCAFWKLNSVSQNHNLDLSQIMDISLSLEPPLVNEKQYSQIGSKRSPLLSGSYLPMIFNDLLPTYSLFSKTALVGASGVKNESTEEKTNITKSSSTKSIILTGNVEIDDSVVDLTQQPQNFVSNKQRFLKSIRDAFNIEMNDFHVKDEIIFKNVLEESAKSSSRPTSMVIETPKRSSSISASAMTASMSSYRYSTNSSHFSALDNMNFFLKNVGNETDKMTAETVVQVVLKSCTLDKIFDILVLTASVFSKTVDGTDLKTFFQSLQQKHQQQLQLQKVASGSNSARASKSLLLRTSIFNEEGHTPQRNNSRASHTSNLQMQSQQMQSFGLLDLPLINFFMDNSLFTETFFNTYKSFTTSSIVLEKLAKRFIGAPSCAYSITQQKTEISGIDSDVDASTATRFPQWDLKAQELSEFSPELWTSVVNIQLGVLDALYFFIKEHYADFTADLKNHSTIVDFLKIVDEELNHEWKYRLKKLAKLESGQSPVDAVEADSSLSFEDSDIISALDNDVLGAPLEVVKKLDSSPVGDLKDLVDKLADLFNKVKSSYQRYYFRPLNYNKLQKNILNNLMTFNSVSPFEYHNTCLQMDDPMYNNFASLHFDDYEKIIDWVYHLDDVVIQKLKMVHVNEWLEAGQFLDLFSYGSLVSFFQNDLHTFDWNLINGSKNSDKKNIIHDNLEIANIFSWLTSLNNNAKMAEDSTCSASGPKHVLVKLPYSIQLIFKFHHSLTVFFILQISNPAISQLERLDVCCNILQLLLFVRWKNSQVNLFEDDGIDTQSDISPHVPSFLESCIVESILSPESRYYEMTWEMAYQKLSNSKESLESMGSLISNVDRERIIRFVEFDGINKRKNLSPCPGWFIGRLLEISQFVPNMSIENSKLINFDKRRFLNNMISNYCDMIPEVDEELSKTENKSFARILFSDISKDMILSYRTHCKAKSKEEAQLYQYENHGLFEDILNMEIESVVRNQYKYEELSAQEVQKSEIDEKNNRNYQSYDQHASLQQNASEGTALSTNFATPSKPVLSYSSSSSVSTLTSSVPGKSANRRSSVMGSFKSSKSSTQDHQPRSSRIGGFFKRPFSISGFSSSASNTNLNNYLVNNNGSIAPQALPSITAAELKDVKSQIVVKTFEVKSCMPLHSYKHNPHCSNAFKICLSNGTDYCVQATSLEDMNEWIALINVSKRYSFHSLKYRGKTHNKVFGVPLEDVCERENVLIPTIVNRLLEEIELRGLDEVGLYRVPGSLGSINALKAVFDTYGAQGSSDFTLEDDRWFEINTIAGCFKLYLRELPESLFTDERLNDFINVMVKYKDDGDSSAMEASLRDLIKQLPTFNFHMMKRLFQHLNKVHTHYKNNRMDATNLAIVFSMSFIDKDDLAMTVGPQLGAVQTALQQLIRSPDLYFS